jgi:hypothetical protein
MISVYLLNKKATPEHLGLVPGFLDETDPRPAREQFEEQYIGGWMPMDGFKRSGTEIKYPGDPWKKPFAVIAFRDERIFAYESAFFMIVQPDGSFEIARMD